MNFHSKKIHFLFFSIIFSSITAFCQVGEPENVENEVSDIDQSLSSAKHFMGPDLSENDVSEITAEDLQLFMKAIEEGRINLEVIGAEVPGSLAQAPMRGLAQAPEFTFGLDNQSLGTALQYPGYSLPSCYNEVQVLKDKVLLQEQLIHILNECIDELESGGVCE